MPNRKKDVTPNSTTISGEKKRIENEIADLNEARKRLRDARRLLNSEQFRAIPRRGRIEPNGLYTLPEVAAIFKPDAPDSWERTVREKLEERDTLHDPFAKGCLLFYGQHIIDAVARRAEQCHESGSLGSRNGANGSMSPGG